MIAIISNKRSEPSRIQSHSSEEDSGGGPGTNGFTPIGRVSFPIYEVENAEF